MCAKTLETYYRPYIVGHWVHNLLEFIVTTRFRICLSNVTSLPVNLPIPTPFPRTNHSSMYHLHSTVQYNNNRHYIEMQISYLRM